MNHNPKVVQSVQSAISSTWHRGVQDFNEGMHDNHTFQEFKLNGNPWLSTSEETVEARKLLLEIIAQMALIGFKFHAAINIKVLVKCQMIIWVIQLVGSCHQVVQLERN